jgi:glycosyltransferase involved in cell wall biosynthesis
MMIVHIIIGLGRGGAEMVLARLVEAHRANPDYEHVVISLTDLGRYGAQMIKMGVLVYALGLKSAFGLPRVFWRLVRRLRELKPDVVQTWMYHADMLGGLAAKLAGGPPVIWGVHSFDLRRGANRTTRIVQKLCALSSSWLPKLILCVAEASRRNHIAVGYEAGRMLVVPNGFDVKPTEILSAEVEEFRTRYRLRPEHVVVGCVGRFHPAKDHRNFVEAAVLLGPEFPQARFMMVGAGLDANNSALQSWIEAGGMSDRFVLLGERSDVPLCLCAIDVFCSSSCTEAFPLVVGEAMVLARPLVVTDVGDTALLVGDTAIVVDRENPQALARGLSTLLRASVEQRQALGQRAQARVRREFSIEQMISRTVSAYGYALQSKD